MLTYCSGLEDVIHDNLRPPDPAPRLRTKGRKNATKRSAFLRFQFLLFVHSSLLTGSSKIKETGEVDSSGESVVLSDVEKEGDGELGDEAEDAGRVADEENGIEEAKKVGRKAGVKKVKTEEDGLEKIDGDEEVKEEVEEEKPKKKTPVKRGKKQSVVQTVQSEVNGEAETSPSDQVEVEGTRKTPVKRGKKKRAEDVNQAGDPALVEETEATPVQKGNKKKNPLEVAQEEGKEVVEEQKRSARGGKKMTAEEVVQGVVDEIRDEVEQKKTPVKRGRKKKAQEGDVVLANGDGGANTHMA